MQFRLTKEIHRGRYFVNLELTEFTSNDEGKSLKFGTPKLIIRMANGNNGEIPVNTLQKISPFGFYTQEEADQYVDFLKTQVANLKKEWNSLEDSWSDEEIL